MFFLSKHCKTRQYLRHIDIKTTSKIAAATVVGLTVIVYLLNSHLSKRTSKHIAPFSIFRETVDLSCFFFGKTKVSKSKPIDERSIFVVDSACASLDLRKACTIESAAKTHPRWTVHIIFYGHERSHRKTKIFLSKLKAYKNIVIKRIELPEYFVGTPLEPLLTLESIKTSEFPEYLVSDLVKMATLYNYGGVCLSWDVIVEKSFRRLPDDFLVKEPKQHISSKILRLSNREVGKELISNIASVINMNFKIWLKKLDLLGNALREVCDNSTIASNACHDIPIYDSEYFPSTYAHAAAMSASDDAWRVRRAVASIAGRVLSRNNLVHKAYFINLAKKFCPRTIEVININRTLSRHN